MRDDLPTGTVTFLFTDIQGSTRLLDELGAAAYADALAEHRRVVRDTCSPLGGVEVDTQGDAFFIAFGRAPDALQAAELITQRLREGPIRLRIGVYTGTPLLTDEGYVGADVHRAARIAAAGHGGQVLVSASTAALADVPLRDLGEHRFKDLASPERVFQLGDETFPPLNSLYRSNLPVPATPFLGREPELAAIAALLRGPGARLVTLIGPGGTGKTRLALQAAAEVSDEYAGGVFWAALAPLRDAALVLPALASAVGVAEHPNAAPIDDLAQGLAGRHLLAFLDNAEHLMPGAADAIGEFIAACPTVTTIVTSRERLQLPGERVYAVPPMSPLDGETLFRRRASEAGVTVESSDVVRALCARLDDLPLALELAAARTVVFSPAQLLDRVSHRLDLLKAGRGVDARQATLRATIAWSHDLLDANEQALFRRMSVFVGGCSLVSAEAVTGADADVVQSLLDKSLLRRTDGPHGPRFWMLETIREFAHERLEDAGEGDRLARRHLEHYAAIAEEAFDEKLRGHDDLETFREERENLRRALDVAEASDPQLALAMAAHLIRSWIDLGAIREGRERIATALAGAPEAPEAARAAAHYGAGLLAWYQTDLDAIEREAGTALELYTTLSDRRGAGSAHVLLGWIPLRKGGVDMSGARRELEAAVAAFVEIGDDELRLTALGFLALAMDGAGDWGGAVALLQEVVAGLRLDGSPYRLATTLGNLGVAYRKVGDEAQAVKSLEEALVLFRQIDSSFGVANSLFNLGYGLRQTDPAEALRLYAESLRLSREREDPSAVAYCLQAVSGVLESRGDVAPAARMLAAALATYRNLGISLPPEGTAESDETAARCRASLTDEQFSRAWAEGAALGVIATADWALHTLETLDPAIQLGSQGDHDVARP